eukprot:14551-Eustigmatos_ZCMA.PRE.1
MTSSFWGLTDLFNAEEVEAVIVGDEVDGEAQVAVAPRAADAVEVGLGRLGEVEVDHHVYRLNVDTSREQVCKEAEATTCGSNAPRGGTHVKLHESMVCRVSVADR